MKRAALLVAVFVLAGCGGTTTPQSAPKAPRIPRVLAQSWEAQASAVAQSLAAGDGCTALEEANALRDSVAQSQALVPQRLRATLTAVVGQLPARITCNPPAPPPDHGNGKDHGKHKGPDGGDG